MPLAAKEFEALYLREGPALRRFVRFLGADRASAEDIVAETFTRVWMTAGPIRKETIRPYLFTIARNLYRRAMKHAHRDHQLPSGWIDDQISIQRHAEDRSDLAAALRAMQSLPEDDRVAILMRAVDQMSYEEIGRILGLSVANSKVRVHRARRKLISLLSFPSEEEAQ